MSGARQSSGLALVALALGVLTLCACGTGTPAPPTAPTQTLTTVTALTISGLPGSLSVGQSVQLTASVTLADGAQKLTSDAMWTSSNATVATVSAAGLLSVTGFGDADVTATFQSVRGMAHVALSKPSQPPVTYDISGVVHESAPTEDIAVPGATVGIHFVGCPSCPHDNQTTTTDGAGRFTLPGIETAGFTLWVNKPGYDPAPYGIVQLPRDQHADISLSPTAAEVRLDIQGHNVCTERRRDPFFPGDWLLAELPVHHDGVLHSLCGLVPCSCCPFHIGSGSEVYRVGPNGQPVILAYGYFPQGGPADLPVQGGYRYYYAAGADFDLCPQNYSLSISYPR